MLIKFLGIDYGSSKIGLALGNSKDMLSLPYNILNEEEFFNNITSIIDQEEIAEIVVGYPMNMSNHETKQTDKTKIFIEKLKKIVTIPIHMEDERMTSLMGQKLQRQGGAKVTRGDDSAAASLILDSFLQRKYVK